MFPDAIGCAMVVVATWAFLRLIGGERERQQAEIALLASLNPAPPTPPAEATAPETQPPPAAKPAPAPPVAKAALAPAAAKPPAAAPKAPAKAK